MKTTPFYEVALEISEDMESANGVCGKLIEHNLHWAEKFSDLFEPTDEERLVHGQGCIWWMRCKDKTPAENNDFRILALLLCHQIYLSETK